MRNEFSILQHIAEGLLKWGNETLFDKLTIHDIIWGYKEPLITKFVNLAKDFHINLNISEDFGLFVGVSINFILYIHVLHQIYINMI